MALHDAICWRDLNGWGNVTGESEAEAAEECRRLRSHAEGVFPYCAIHGSDIDERAAYQQLDGRV